MSYCYYEDVDRQVWVLAKKTVDVSIAIDIDEIAKHICTRDKALHDLVTEVMEVAVRLAETGHGEETSRGVCLKKWQASATYKADAPNACNNAWGVAMALHSKGKQQEEA